MDVRKKCTWIVSGIFFIVIFMGPYTLEAKRIPKITNFIMLVDLSGSMFEKHAATGKLKAFHAKSVLLAVNERIPELGYTCAVTVFSPKRTLIGPEPYDRMAFMAMIQGLPEKGEIFGNLTPLGPAIKGLDKILEGFSGKTDIIIISDGRANEGMNPVEAVKYIREKYPNSCFHVISLADTDKGKNNLMEISKLGTCSFYDGLELYSDATLNDRFISEVFYLDVEEDAPPQLPPPALAVEKEKPERFAIEGIFFDFNKYNIKPFFAVNLDEGLEKLQKYPEARIIIEGHTDNVGSEQYNQKLSERRARAVYDYFLGKGIAAERMTTIGYGESMPSVSNLTPHGRAINRRVEIIVVQ